MLNMKRTNQRGYKEIVRGAKNRTYTVVVQLGYDEYLVKTYTRAWLNRRNKSNAPGRTEGIKFIKELKEQYPNNFIFAFEKQADGKVKKANIEEVEWW